jgi:hypothetical protein
MMVKIGDLVDWSFDPAKKEETEIRKELQLHKCSRCIVEKRLQKDRRANFELLSEIQRSIYKAMMHRPHLCGSTDQLNFKYEKCACRHPGEVHVEETPNNFGKCNIKNCICTKYRCAHV